MRYTIIVNPAAGNGAAARRRAPLRHALQRYGIDADVVEARTSEETRRLAREAAHNSEAVIAAGGDGTVQDVARGIIASGTEAALGVIPLGTGNDFYKMLSTSRSISEAVAILRSPIVQAADYGIVRCRTEAGSAERIFLNAVGTGFDAKVAEVAPRFKKLPGVLGYLAAVFRTLGRWTAPQVEIVARRDTAPVYSYQGSLFLITAANGRCTGGGFFLTPEASICDGLLDVCLIEDLTVRRVLTLIPRVLRGRHLGAPEVHLSHADHLHVRTSHPLPVHADGEIVVHDALELEVSIVAAGLRVLAAPAGT